MNRPYMKKKEWAFLQNYLSKDVTMLEYGSGFSTLAMSSLVKELWSVEHDECWFYKVQDMIAEKQNVHLHLVKNNFPRSIPTKFEQFETYINWIKNIDVKFDVVLLDGRARQWCAESIIPNLKSEHLVFLHDFTSQRPHYNRVLNFYTVIDQVGSMVLLKKL